MKILLGSITLILLVLAVLAALFWMGGVAGVVTGGGRNTSELNYLLTLAGILLGLACLSGLLALVLPGAQ